MLAAGPATISGPPAHACAVMPSTAGSTARAATKATSNVRPSGRRRPIALALVCLKVAWSAPGHAAPFAYVVNHGDATVTVVDTATNAVVATVEVGDEPLAAAVNPAGTRAYVTNQVAPSGTVSVIDTAINGVIATVTVGARPSGAAVKPPGDRVYVTNRDDKNVSVIDTASNTVVATIPVGNNPLGIAIDPAGTPAYVVNKGDNAVSVIDTTSNQVIATIPVGNDPSHVTVGPNGRRAYVSNTSNASVTVIDSGLTSVAATIPVGNIPEGVAVDPAGTRLYVANSGPNSVSVVDTASNAVIATVNVGLTPFELAFRPDGARVFVANRQNGNVSVIDTASNTVAATVPAGFTPAGFGQFIVPALRSPVFGKDARTCQAGLAKQAIKLTKSHHALEATCRLNVIKAEAAGFGTTAAEAACLKALDPVNPLSKLSIARAKFRAAVAKSCAVVSPSQINGPCARAATGIAVTADCVIAQHATRVAALVGDEESATRPIPLVGTAQLCQSSLFKSGRKFADRIHAELAKCVDKLVTLAAAGKSDVKAAATCRASLDLANPVSKASKARAAALASIARQCAGVTPAAIGSPCDPGAPTTAAMAACMLDGHLADVGKLIAAEYNDACTMLTRAGVATTHSVCSGS
jgi:YVTN family beta-propeller protein